MNLGNGSAAARALVLAVIVPALTPNGAIDRGSARSAMPGELSARLAGVGPPAGLTRDEWSQIRRQVVESSYHASPVSRPGPDPVLRAANPRQGYGTTFRRDGIELAPLGSATVPWRLALSVTGYGYEGGVSGLGDADPRADKDRVEYRRGLVTEWYVNRPGGLEQGFELQQPRPRRAGPLVVAMAVQGDVDVRARDGGASFADRSGAARLRYAGLEAWDADGRPVASRMEVAGREIRLVVDAQAARFPVTVDPTFFQEALLTGHGDPPEVSGTGFGFAVAVEGDTAAIGAYKEALGGPSVGAAYVFVRSGGAWSQQQKLLALDGGFGDQFGWSIALSGDTVVVGAPFDDTTLNDVGSAYVFTRTGTFWTQQQKLTASDGTTGDQFGWRVAVAGDTVVAGAPFDDVAAQADRGSAYVFVRSGTTWSEQQHLLSSDGAAGDNVGSAVAIAGDTAVVGAAKADTAGGGDAGAAYVFVRSGTTWTEQQKLTASDGGAADAFGSGASISGETAAVGAPGDTVSGLGGAGSAYVFVRSGTTWAEQQKLVAADPSASASFGSSVSVSFDTAMVGAPNDGFTVGAAYAFVRSGTAWTQQQKILSGALGVQFFGTSVSVSGDTALIGQPTNTSVGSAYVYVRSGATWSLQAFLPAPYNTALDQFGHSISLSGDTLALGAPRDNTPNGADSGSAYVFVHSGAAWTEQALLRPSDGAADDQFGFSVSVDGDTLVVGAAHGDTAGGADAGSAYVFVRSGTTWTEQQKLTASDGAAGDLFGNAVSVSGDTAVVGAINDDTAAGGDAGSAYVFVRSGTTWTEQQKLTASDGTPLDEFGAAVSISGDTTVVGATAADTAAGSTTGSAYVFVRSGTTWTEQQKLTAPDAAPFDGFGKGVSVSGDTAVIGASRADPAAGVDAGAAYVFVRSGATWSEQQKLSASDGLPGDQFGYDVAVSGDTAVVGAHSADLPGAPDAGAAYVFLRAGAAWTEQPKIVAPDAANGDALGFAVSLATDVVAAGAPLDDTSGGADAGSVRVFRKLTVQDLGVTKTDGVTTAAPGQVLTYTIRVSNAGPDAANGATVTDAVPAALTGAAWTCSATAGSTCTASGAGSINDTVNLLVGGIATYLLTGTVDPAATGTLSNTVTVTPPLGGYDPNAGDNGATDTDTLVPSANLALAKTDSPDPVLPGGPLVYVVTVTNLGPSNATGVTLVDTLPSGVTFVSSTPGAPTCVFAAPTLTCNLGALAGAAASTVTINTTVSPSAAGILVNTASVSATESDPDPGNNSAFAATAVGRRTAELGHGSDEVYDLAAQPGPVADVDEFRINQKPRSSYEVVIDAASGDIGAGNGPVLERIGPDGTTVLQSAVPVGAGPSRSLRWRNTTASVVEGETVRVKSAGCGTDCGPDDTYRIRAYETSYSIPRLNNAGTQVTVLILQNPTSDPIAGDVYFRNTSGALVATQSFSLVPRQALVLNTATVPGVAGVSGTITVAHNGRYGDLAGKAVALEPATGFSFDSALEPRVR